MAITQEKREMRRGLRNVGGPERGIRMGVGAGALAAMAMARRPWLRTALGVVGFGGLITGALSFCPVNRAVGRDSFHH